MRYQRSLIGVVLILFFAETVRAGDVEDLRQLDKDLSVATWAGDAVWFERHVADDFALITPTGTMRTKLDVIRELATPGLEMEPYDPLEVSVRVYGDTAVVTGRILQRFTLGRVRYANDLRYTDVWIRRKGKWLLISGHTSSVAVRR